MQVLRASGPHLYIAVAAGVLALWGNKGLDLENLIALLLIVILALLAAGLWRKMMQSCFIMPGETGLLYGSQGFVRELPPGMHRWTNLSGSKRLFRVRTTEQALSSHLIEVISNDHFAFRVTLTPLVTVTDSRAVIEHANLQQHADPAIAAALAAPSRHYERLWPVLSAAVLETVAAITLEEFLADPGAALAPVAARAQQVLPGTRLDGLLVTAITLPPEIRKMFTEVERARREGLAGLERARAEQASLRALANAARNLNDNPALAQLRMLQVMENAKGAKTFVLGSPSEDMKPKPG